jgi:hypothetical protein
MVFPKLHAELNLALCRFRGQRQACWRMCPHLAALPEVIAVERVHDSSDKNQEAEYQKAEIDCNGRHD